MAGIGGTAWPMPGQFASDEIRMLITKNFGVTDQAVLIHPVVRLPHRSRYQPSTIGVARHADAEPHAVAPTHGIDGCGDRRRTRRSTRGEFRTLLSCLAVHLSTVPWTGLPAHPVSGDTRRPAACYSAPDRLLGELESTYITHARAGGCPNGTGVSQCSSRWASARV